MSSNRNASARKSRLAMMARRQFLAAGLALTAALSLRRNTAFAQGHSRHDRRYPPGGIYSNRAPQAGFPGSLGGRVGLHEYEQR